MNEWNWTIDDNLKSSKLWKARGRDGAKDGCCVCGATDGAALYAFGRRRLKDSGSDEYDYALPVRKKLCPDCVKWEYRHKIMEKGLGWFGAVMCLALLAVGIDMLVKNGLSGLGDATFAVFVLIVGGTAGAFFALRYALGLKKLKEEDGDMALMLAWTGCRKQPALRDYYTRAESKKTRNDPLFNPEADVRLLNWLSNAGMIAVQRAAAEDLARAMGVGTAPSGGTAPYDDRNAQKQ